MAPEKPTPPPTRKKSSGTFEFCEVCRRNHDQGRRHNYSASHARSLSSLLSKFHQKISPIIQNPISPNPYLDRIWCIFCGIDVVDGSLTRGSVIYHLASLEHLKSVKGFLKKHGGGLDQLDSVRVSEDDLIKKGRKSPKIASPMSSEGPIGQSPGPSKDIQYKLTSNNMDSFANHSMSSFHSNAYHSVMPLQSLTNGGDRISPSEVIGATGSVSSTTVALSGGLQKNMASKGMDAIRNVAVSLTGNQPMQLGGNGKILAGQSLSYATVGQTGSGKDCGKVLQKFTQISAATAAEGSQSNVHTGALPPWLDANEEKEINQLIIGPCTNEIATSAGTGKSRKLNPKRVGAAWAERRRLELEMEKRGERDPDTVDANWLPNFGRVWQAGTRKESRKEFETVKRKFLGDDKQPELSLKVQPYISKRMRAGSQNGVSAVCGCAKDTANALEHLGL